MRSTEDAAPEDQRYAIARIVAGQPLLQPVRADALRRCCRFHAVDTRKERFSPKEMAYRR